MRALHWDGQRLSLNPETPQPEPADALLRVRLAGICSTDLQIFKGYMGFVGIPGHEAVGDVVSGPPHWVGRRAVAEINFGCRRCDACVAGMKRHCPQRRVMGILGADGAFAEFVAVPSENLHAVLPGVSDEEAVFVEPLAAAFEILEQVHVTPGIDVVVLGDGKLGLLCAQVLALAGARVRAVGRHDCKLSVLRPRGIEVLTDAGQAAPADLVIEATGSSAGLAAAMRIVRPRGTLVLKSTIAGEHTLSLAPLVINEVTVVGSRCGPFEPALRALAEKRISVLPIIERSYPLEEGILAVEHASRHDAMKVLIRPWSKGRRP